MSGSARHLAALQTPTTCKDMPSGATNTSSPVVQVMMALCLLHRHRRLAVRDAWASRCQVPGVSVCRFILSDDEVTELVQEEMQEHHDIVLVHGETTYKSILLKTLFVFEYAISHYDARFILKTDDDAFVHTWAMVQQLRLLCESPDCRRERLYMGKQCRCAALSLSAWSTLLRAVAHWRAAYAVLLLDACGDLNSAKAHMDGLAL